MLQTQKKSMVTSRSAAAAQKREDQILEHIPLIKYHAYRIATQLPPNIEINDLINAGILGLDGRDREIRTFARSQVQDLRRASHSRSDD